MIRGEVKIVKRDIHTGEITGIIEETNVVPRWRLNDMASAAGDVGDNHEWGQLIFLGERDQDVYYDGRYVYDVKLFGTIELGITSPDTIWNWPPPRYLQYQNRFNPGASTRTIYIIGISTRTSAENYRSPLDAQAYLRLSSPCTQLTTETLDVFYRLIFDNDTAESGLTPSQMDILMMNHRYNQTNDTRYPLYNSTFVTGKLIQDIFGLPFSHARRAFGSENLATLTGRSTSNGAYALRQQHLNASLSQVLGRIIGTVGFDNRPQNNQWIQQVFQNKAIKPTTNTRQNIFPHGASATKPFYDSTALPSGSATIGVNSDSWINPDYHKLLRINITGSGEVGTATYNFSIRDVIGVVNNTYEDDHVAIPFINSHFQYDKLPPMFTGQGAAATQGPMAKAYSTTEFAVFDYNVLSVVDFMTADATKFDSTTTPALNATKIGQVEVASNGDIWVACENTGLYRIHADFLTIDHFTTDIVIGSSPLPVVVDSCYGVTEGNGKLWAVFEGILASTIDGGSTWTVYDGVSTPTFALTTSAILAIQADVNGANDEIAIIYDQSPSNTNFDLYWWDSVSGQHTNMISSFADNSSVTDRRDIFQMLTCSPNDSLWGIVEANSINGPAMFSFGASSYTIGAARPKDFSVWTQLTHIWVKSSNGDDGLKFWAPNSSDPRVAILKQDNSLDLTTDLETVDPSGAQTHYLESMGARGVKAWFPNGMFIFTTLHNFSNSIYKAWMMGMAGQNNIPDGGSFHHSLWKDYGWNGAAWVQDHVGDKTTHAGDEALIQGIVNSFNISGSPIDTFVSGDYYTCGIVDGVWVDGAVEVDFDSNLYYSPAEFGLTDFETVTLPGTTSKQWFNQPLTWTDIVNRTPGTSHISRDGGTGGCRSLTESGTSDDCSFEFRFDTGSTPTNSFIGLSNVSKRGTALNSATIDYGFRIFYLSGDDYNYTIVENGSVVFTGAVDAASFGGYSAWNRNNEDEVLFKITRTGTTIEYYFRDALVYTSLVASSTSLCIDAVLDSSVGAHYMNYYVAYTDYFFEFGNSTGSPTATGKFDPKFQAVVANFASDFDVKFNGTSISQISTYSTTALNSGEISVWYLEGAARFAAVDAGKTLTGTYSIIKRV